jgi:hypothetical protein
MSNKFIILTTHHHHKLSEFTYFWNCEFDLYKQLSRSLNKVKFLSQSTIDYCQCLSVSQHILWCAAGPAQCFKLERRISGCRDL